MTDKEISKSEQVIIDGCDVSGCKNLMQGIVPFGCMEDRKTCSCMNNPNCLYKNWQRKEQECESLRNLLVEQNDVMKTNELMIKEFGIEILKDITTDNITVRSIKLIELKQQLDQLKEENEELKEKCKRYGEINEQETKDYVELEADNEKLNKSFEDIAKAMMEICNQCSERDDYNIPCMQIRELDYSLQLEIEENEKLRQTLIEIKEIADLSIAHFDIDYLKQAINEILQKCEVLNEKV